MHITPSQFRRIIREERERNLNCWGGDILSEIDDIFFASPDDDKPGGGNGVAMFSSGDKYELAGTTHGGVSHAIKHLSEFDPAFVNSSLSSAIEIAKSSPSLVFLNLKKGNKLTGEEAVKNLTPQVIKNTLDFINDKIANGETLSDDEKKFVPIMDDMYSRYVGIIKERFDSAPDVNDLPEEEVEKIINGGGVIKFKVAWKGKNRTIYADFGSSAIATTNEEGKYGTFSTVASPGNIAAFKKRNRRR